MTSSDGARAEMRTRMRTHTCGALRSDDVGEEVALCGWLHTRRDLGGLLFLDLRDHYGITQIVVRPGSGLELAHTPKETVLRIEGRVIARSPETVNAQLATGEVEVEALRASVLGSSSELPFPVFPEEPSPEDTRLRYRFLDLRRSRMHANIELRSQVIAGIRGRMQRHGFLEIQTPTLTASSPEGARDYLVPSRLHPGQFYALPQAPQQFKQLLMTAGFDRYFQIAPCYRDEAARADRSPGEFYQLDIEMSFVEQEDIFEVVEDVLHDLFLEFAPDATVPPPPFPRIPYDTAFEKYGTDKPDLRIGLEMQDLTAALSQSGIRALEAGYVAGLRLPTPQLSRAALERLDELARSDGAKGLAWFVVEDSAALRGPLARHMPADLQSELASSMHARTGDVLLLIADDDRREAQRLLGNLRVHLGQELGLIEQGVYRFCWVVDFPMYELDPETHRVVFSHNPFSMPQGGMDALSGSDPLAVKAFQYDIVCNGCELSSGAIRNHRPDILYRAFEIAGYAKAEVDEQFGALGRAFALGAPPHGGIAPGIDRIVMLIAGEPNIREVIAFPMNQRAQDLLMGAPSVVDDARLRELNLALLAPPAEQEPPQSPA
jgi:aspartyl-tRNA synthetase